jgi:type I restriction enzyme S subunit
MAYQKALHRVRPHEVLDSRFMLHQFAFLAQTNSFDGLATGSTIRHLPQQQLRRVPVVVPPLAEQRRIVDILEGHLSHLDAANDYLDAAAQRAASLRWAAVATRILTPAPKVTRHALEGVLTEYVGGVWGGPPGSDEVDVDVLRVTELKPWGRIDPSTAAHRAVSDRQLNRRRLRTGDLLLEKSGGGIGTPIGRVGLVPNLKATSVCSNFMQLMRPDTSKVVPRYLHLYLNALQATGRTEHLQKASTNLRNIKASEYSRLELDLPDLLTQELVVREIDTLWEQSARSEEVAIASRRREGTLRRRIIAAAFSGQLTGHVSDVDRVEELSFL